MKNCLETHVTIKLISANQCKKKNLPFFFVEKAKRREGEKMVGKRTVN